MSVPEDAARHGIWRILPSPQLSEILAQAGLNFQILDCEHGPYDYATLLPDILACEAQGSDPWVRVAGDSKVEVQRCIDLGARGIVFPQLDTAEDFLRAASWMDHAPRGERGYNPFVRAGRYGMAVTEAATDRPAFVPIVETLTAVESLDRVLRNERIDLIYLGTYDLSAQLGCPGEMSHPRVIETVNHILEQCARHGVATGMMALDPASSERLQERGVRAIVHGVDTHRIRDWAGTLVHRPS